MGKISDLAKNSLLVVLQNRVESGLFIARFKDCSLVNVASISDLVKRHFKSNISKSDRKRLLSAKTNGYVPSDLAKISELGKGISLYAC